jgi:hypothetical protein
MERFEMNYNVFACRCRRISGELTNVCSPFALVANLKPHPNAHYFNMSRHYAFVEASHPAFNLRTPISIIFGATYEKNINA